MRNAVRKLIQVPEVDNTASETIPEVDNIETSGQLSYVVSDETEVEDTEVEDTEVEDTEVDKYEPASFTKDAD